MNFSTKEITQAIICLGTDNFVFKIAGSLTLCNITISGLDMHISPVPYVPTCISETNLSDPTSICYLQKQTNIPNNNDFFNGFIILCNF